MACGNSALAHRTGRSQLITLKQDGFIFIVIHKVIVAVHRGESTSWVELLAHVDSLCTHLTSLQGALGIKLSRIYLGLQFIYLHLGSFGCISTPNLWGVHLVRHTMQRLLVLVIV